MSDNECVEFAGKSSALPGAIAGAFIAVGVPAVTLFFGRGLASSLQLTIVLVGVGVGGLIALTATFFSLVIPSKVNGYGGTCCNCGKPTQSVREGTVEQRL
jgi:hypothetical protein